MKNLSIYFILIISIMAFSSCGVDPFEPAPLAAQEAAMTGLETYKALGSTNFAEHGFSSDSELQSATLGEGISIHYMHIPSLSLHDITTHPGELIEDNEEWMFEVIAGGSVKAAITVHNYDGTWEVTEMGNEDVAKSIAEAKNKHMSENDLEHDAYRVVRIPGMYHYWVSFKENARNHFIHVYDRPEHGHAKHAVQSARDVIADIIQSVKDFKSAVVEP